MNNCPIKCRVYGFTDIGHTKKGMKVFSLDDLIMIDNNSESIQMLNRLDDSTPMQFTDLKDEHGREIFEGDIINVGAFSEAFGLKYIVKYGIYKTAYDKDKINSDSHTGFHLTLIGNGNYIYPLYQTKYFKVIGNIFENPELLK